MSKKKAKTKKVVFDDLSNNPYAVPCLSAGLHDGVHRLILTTGGVLVQLEDRKVYHVDRDEDTISVFDYAKELREGWCALVGIKPKHLEQYAEEAMAEQRVADAKALLTQHGYLVTEPLV